MKKDGFKFWIFLLMVIWLVGCAPNPVEKITSTDVPQELISTTPVSEAGDYSTRSKLPDLGAAPEIMNEVWLNTDKPLRLADLRGQVILLDMWTFG